ncbi:hypothetical protein ACW4YW_15415 [Methylobacillus pratensis]
MEKLIQSVDILLKKITSKKVEKESLEWYLINNLNDYRTLLINNPSLIELENATRALIRFCTESIDWDSTLYKDCSEITTLGMRSAKDTSSR